MRNVKKRSAHNICLGVYTKTGEVRHISEVVSGAKCGCVCASCGKPLEARKGAIRRHHFAHDSNYDCMYANEVAIYKMISEILACEQVLCVPAVTLRFGNWKTPVELRPKQFLKLQKVEFHCDSQQYPPELEVTASGSKLMILIEFSDRYYSAEDMKTFKIEARENNISLLFLTMPRIKENEENDYYTRGNLTKCLTEGGVQARWLRSALEDSWRKRYLDKATGLKRIQGRVKCPLHKGILGEGEQFYVNRGVCNRCEYYLEEEKCIGASGIREISDFELTSEELVTRIAAIQKQNEEETAELERRRIESQRRMDGQQRMLQQQKGKIASVVPPVKEYNRPILSRQIANEMHKEAQRIFACFDPLSREKTIDKFSRRWIKCKLCGEIRQDTEMVEYGGPEGPNIGICRTCSRQS